ncbi:hypothetical protein [Nonomuraea sp. NPDC048901]|uniref:hypothetical protein n=1 Tax=Nonomuraea sp. NPDC048901 TaxID=3155627 RepID=UPI0033CFDD66
MLQEPPALPESWADICALKRRLRQQAKEAGHLPEWRELDRAARTGADTLEKWLSLCAKIAESGRWYGSYVIRDGLTEDGDEDAEQLYGCPNQRRCERIATATSTGAPPLCDLSAEPMAPLR